MKTLLIDYNGPIIKADNFFEDRSKRIAKIFNAKWTKNFQGEWGRLYIDATAGKITLNQYYKKISNILDKKLQGYEDEKFIQKERLSDIHIPKYLKRLRGKFGSDLKIGLLSNYIEHWVMEVLNRYSIKQYFDAIVVSDRIRTRKPDSKAYTMAARIMDVDVKNCIYIGDEKEDLDGANAVGMIVIFIPGEDMESEYPMISNLGEIEKFLT